jgi:hypothetical protein
MKSARIAVAYVGQRARTYPRPARSYASARGVVQYAQTHPGVSCMRKVDIASYAITSPRTVREDI